MAPDETKRRNQTKKKKSETGPKLSETPLNKSETGPKKSYSRPFSRLHHSGHTTYLEIRTDNSH
jgi:hypothetical protein